MQWSEALVNLINYNSLCFSEQLTVGSYYFQESFGCCYNNSGKVCFVLQSDLLLLCVDSTDLGGKIRINPFTLKFKKYSQPS